jgi:predicted ATPase
MIIGISGSGGSGKSTILTQLEQLGLNVITRKTSRSILSDWGVSLEEINNDIELTLKFQQEIIERKYEDERLAVQDNQIWFTERTYADLMSYFLITLGKNNTYTKQVSDYYKQCIAYQQSYHKVFYLKAGHFTPVHDGVRGANIHFSRMVDLVMQDLTEQMTVVDKLSVVHTPCLDQRLQIILAHSGVLPKENW